MGTRPNAALVRGYSFRTSCGARRDNSGIPGNPVSRDGGRLGSIPPPRFREEAPPRPKLVRMPRPVFPEGASPDIAPRRTDPARRPSEWRTDGRRCRASVRLCRDRPRTRMRATRTPETRPKTRLRMLGIGLELPSTTSRRGPRRGFVRREFYYRGPTTMLQEFGAGRVSTIDLRKGLQSLRARSAAVRYGRTSRCQWLQRKPTEAVRLLPSCRDASPLPRRRDRFQRT